MVPLMGQLTLWPRLFSSSATSWSMPSSRFTTHWWARKSFSQKTELSPGSPERVHSYPQCAELHLASGIDCIIIRQSSTSWPTCLIKLDKNSWGIQSLLRIHPKLQHVQQHLHKHKGSRRSKNYTDTSVFFPKPTIISVIQGVWYVNLLLLYYIMYPKVEQNH